mmetsp:Transcript_22075/g.21267  ORF Transcript_22075/g.21267 Transcript_22075/m.21267 type:complete len:94 (+) Transcript_22075:2112-2393(+)
MVDKKTVALENSTSYQTEQIFQGSVQVKGVFPSIAEDRVMSAVHKRDNQSLSFLNQKKVKSKLNIRPSSKQLHHRKILSSAPASPVNLSHKYR